MNTIPKSCNIWKYSSINKKLNFDVDNECTRKKFQECNTSRGSSSQEHKMNVLFGLFLEL